MKQKIKESVIPAVKIFFSRYIIASLLVAVLIAFIIFDSSLLSLRNFRNILSDSAPILLVATAMALCLYAGYVNLSIGAIATLAGILAGSFMQSEETVGRFFTDMPVFPIYAVISAITILFCGFGVLYGFLLKYEKLPSWFLTFAGASVLMSLARLYVYDSETIVSELTGFTADFLHFGAGYIGSTPIYSVPITVLISILLVVGLRIGIGRLCVNICPSESIFSAESPAKKTVSTKERMIIYALSCALCAVAGMMLAGREGIATTQIGAGLTIDAISICVIAGFSLFGAKGNFPALCITTFLYVAVIYLSNIIGYNQFVISAIRGVLIIATALIDFKKIPKSQAESSDISAVNN
ncbi:MAG: hypothetical protein R3Y36_03915 [Spirochaetales bacterium]